MKSVNERNKTEVGIIECTSIPNQFYKYLKNDKDKFNILSLCTVIQQLSITYKRVTTKHILEETGWDIRKLIRIKKRMINLGILEVNIPLKREENGRFLYDCFSLNFSDFLQISRIYKKCETDDTDIPKMHIQGDIFLDTDSVELTSQNGKVNEKRDIQKMYKREGVDSIRLTSQNGKDIDNFQKKKRLLLYKYIYYYFFIDNKISSVSFFDANFFSLSSLSENKKINENENKLFSENKKIKNKKTFETFTELLPDQFRENKELVEVWIDYLKMRKVKKWETSKRSAQTLIKDLITLSNMKVEKAIEFISKAEVSNWRAFWPISDSTQKGEGDTGKFNKIGRLKAEPGEYDNIPTIKIRH